MDTGIECLMMQLEHTAWMLEVPMASRMGVSTRNFFCCKRDAWHCTIIEIGKRFEQDARHEGWRGTILGCSQICYFGWLFDRAAWLVVFIIE